VVLEGREGRGGGPLEGHGPRPILREADVPHQPPRPEERPGGKRRTGRWRETGGGGLWVCVWGFVCVLRWLGLCAPVCLLMSMYG